MEIKLYKHYILIFLLYLLYRINIMHYHRYKRNKICPFLFSYAHWNDILFTTISKLNKVLILFLDIYSCMITINSKKALKEFIINENKLASFLFTCI